VYWLFKYTIPIAVFGVNKKEIELDGTEEYTEGNIAGRCCWLRWNMVLAHRHANGYE
jgi:hypothetical protein